jgi:hypothetical protein
MLRGHFLITFVWAAVAVLGATTVAARAADEGATAGVLLLQSGGVLSGEISTSGDRYLVRGEKSRFDVAASQVLLVCSSLEDAYEQQRRRLARPSAESHLTLAEWCLRYELTKQAALELADARKLDARHPRLALLERRLAVIVEPRTADPVAGKTESASEKQMAELRKLDAMAAELPSGTLERFTRKVQPMLVNTCTTSGCHQPNGEQEFQLDRAVLHGLSNRRTTLRNLSATLALVDRGAPQQSRLLMLPRETHGGGKPPLLGTRQEEHLQMLAEWVSLATGKAIPRAELAAAGDATLRPTNQQAHDPHSPTLPTPAAKMLSAQADAAIFDGMPPVRYGVEAASWQPKDEFDPELFNRQSVTAAGAGGPLAR